MPGTAHQSVWHNAAVRLRQPLCALPSSGWWQPNLRQCAAIRLRPARSVCPGGVSAIGRYGQSNFPVCPNQRNRRSLGSKYRAFRFRRNIRRSKRLPFAFRQTVAGCLWRGGTNSDFALRPLRPSPAPPARKSVRSHRCCKQIGKTRRYGLGRDNNPHNSFVAIRDGFHPHSNIR